MTAVWHCADSSARALCRAVELLGFSCLKQPLAEEVSDLKSASGRILASLQSSTCWPAVRAGFLSGQILCGI